MAIKINGNTVIADNQAFTTISTISATGNITGGNLSIIGTITAAGINTGSSPISTTGNVVGGNILTGGTVSATGNITGGNVSATNLTGTLTTAAQTNITSVGTLTALSVTGTVQGGNVSTTGTVSATGNITGGNLLINGSAQITGNLSVSGTETIFNVANLTVNDKDIIVANNVTGGANVDGSGIQAGNPATATWFFNNATTSWQSNIGITPTTNGTLSLGGASNYWGTAFLTAASVTGNVTLGNIVNAGANGVGNIGSATTYFNTVFAKATSAQYADLAEKYTADAEYAPGTVVVFGGTHEVTVNATDADRKVAGVVSTNPSYTMNSGLEADHVATVALTGRVPTMVVGTVRKGDLMVAAGLGRARAEADPRVGTVIGKALEDFNGPEGTIEVVVGRF
jgi:hypothetical protein